MILLALQAGREYRVEGRGISIVKLSAYVLFARQATVSIPSTLYSLPSNAIRQLHPHYIFGKTMQSQGPVLGKLIQSVIIRLSVF